MIKPIIVVDFDDTLCMHLSGDTSSIPDGIPNDRLIKRLQKIEHRYSIHIYTARGHVSATSRVNAEIKYRKIIEDWLKKYEVPYEFLSFNKPLAVYYIDDRAIRPDEINKIL